MPKKVCPKCNAKHGTRKLKCDCGHDFSTKNHPLYPEPGGWVLDGDKKMPPIRQPEPLPKGTIEAKVLRDEYIAYEGLGYCLWEYIPANRIKDPKLRALWVKARKAMLDIVTYLEMVE